MENPEFRALFEKEAAALEVSEFLAQQMAAQDISVRGLAALADVSPTVVQGIKSGKRKNIEYTTLKALTSALGYRIMFQKAGEVRTSRAKSTKKTATDRRTTRRPSSRIPVA